MWYPVWSSAAIVFYVFRYALLYTLVEMSGYLSYVCLTLSPKESEPFYAYYFNGWLDICISKQLNRCTSWCGQWVYFKVHSPWIKHACCNHSAFVHASTLKNPVSGHIGSTLMNTSWAFMENVTDLQVQRRNQQNRNRRNQKDIAGSKIG